MDFPTKVGNLEGNSSHYIGSFSPSYVLMTFEWHTICINLLLFVLRLKAHVVTRGDEMVTEAREQRLIAESLARNIEDTHRQITGKGLVINYGEGGGGYNMGKSLVRNFLRPAPSTQGKTFHAPPPPF